MDDMDRKREEAFQRVVEHRNRLLKALKLAAPEFCSQRCQSVFTSPDQPRHIAECEAMRHALKGMITESPAPRPAGPDIRGLMMQAFEAGHWAWPTMDDPTRAALAAKAIDEILSSLPDAEVKE